MVLGCDDQEDGDASMAAGMLEDQDQPWSKSITPYKF